MCGYVAGKTDEAHRESEQGADTVKLIKCEECGYESEKEEEFVEIVEEDGEYQLCLKCLCNVEDIGDELLNEGDKNVA